MIFDLELLDEKCRVVGMIPNFDQGKGMEFTIKEGPEITITHVRVKGTDELIEMWIPRTIDPAKWPTLCFNAGSVFIAEPDTAVTCKNCGAIQ